MLVNQIQDESDVGDQHLREGDSIDYNTANELFDVMSKNFNYNINNNKLLTTQDLVILYENLDLGGNVACYANQKPKAHNQYVETVVHSDASDSDGSDISEIYTKDDFGDLCMINNERIDFMNSIPSLENILCHKHSNLKLKSSDFVTNYDKNFLFKDSYIKNQLKSLNRFNSFLPMSLLDYICSDQFDDDYNFHMDNVISYVQFTIEQLRRISNGDYLTGIAKDKWREVNIFETKDVQNKVIAKSVNIPVPNSTKNQKAVWKNVVHSEMNLKVINKILEKKIILEIPRLFNGPFTLFGKHCKNTLIIQCKKDKSPYNVKNQKEKDSAMKVALTLKFSDLSINVTGSTILFPTFPTIIQTETFHNNLLALPNTQITNEKESNIKILEVESQPMESNELDDVSAINNCVHQNYINKEKRESPVNTNAVPSDKNLLESICACLDENTFGQTDGFCENVEDFVNVSNPGELAFTIQRLHTQSPIMEEIDKSNPKKKTSPTRIRIKSPYENKSYALEEKKRKRLIEIRERREKRKMAISKNCKVTKNKYGQGGILPQASNSVTKLSITNKSFYDSIYGQATNEYYKGVKRNSVAVKTEISKLGNSSGIIECIHSESSDLINTLVNNDLSYYLDKDVDKDAQNLAVQSKLDDTTSQTKSIVSLRETNPEFDHEMESLVPVNTPMRQNEKESYKLISSIECRKSIDKLYNLMNQFGKVDNSISSTETDQCNVRLSSDLINTPNGSSSSINDSRHNYLITSKLNSRCCKKVLNENSIINKCCVGPPKTTVPTKLQNVKFDEQSIRKARKSKLDNVSLVKNSDNPLKAISQLLHKFDTVQKNNVIKTKVNKKDNMNNISKDNKNITRHLMSPNVIKTEKCAKRNDDDENRVPVFREKKLITAKEALKSPKSQKITEQCKKIEKVNNKRISELIDEVKEMRGEAVRGPKQISRLDSLAQPKKLHVDSPIKENRSKYERNSLNDRHSKNISQGQRNNSANLQKNKLNKASGSITRLKPVTAAIPSEEGVKRRSTSNSPERRFSPVLRNWSPTKGINTNDAPKILKKKMLAVESYVKNHFGQVAPLHKDIKGVQKTRLPLVPADIDLASLTSSPSAEATSSLGDKLHNMVDALINISPITLNALNECDESKLINTSQSISKSDEILSVSDFPIDIFQDKNIVTAVANTSYHKNICDESIIVNKASSRVFKHSEMSSSSLTELEKLENALNGHVTSDTFRKKLRIKNLTPKQSMQQVLLLQSGDTGSMLVKSTLSQKLNASKSDMVSKIHAMSQSRIDWTCKKIPLHCFPVFESFQYKNQMQVLKGQTKNYKVNTIKSETSHECLSKNDKIVCMFNDSIQSELKENYNINDIILFKTDNDNPNKIYNRGIGNNKDYISPNNISKGTTQLGDIDNTTSMDVLVGLLNEIKKISTYQSNLKMDKGITSSNCTLENSNLQSEKCSTSLEKLRQLQTDPSIHSQNVLSNDSYDNSSNDDKACKEINKLKAHEWVISADKEVTANISDKEYIHSFTGTPSHLILSTVNQSTTVSNSLCAIQNRLSEQSNGLDKSYEILYRNSSFYEVSASTFVETDKHRVLTLDIYTKEENTTSKNVMSEYFPTSEILKIENIQVGLTTDLYADPLIKFKRDILVTLYSILVFTVFTALSLPDIMYLT